MRAKWKGPTMKLADARNLNPTPEARLAMLIWGKRYSEQRGGSMDFWDSLTPSEQRICEEGVEKILEAHRAYSRSFRTERPAFSKPK
jgi:hypothetical protein